MPVGAGRAGPGGLRGGVGRGGLRRAGGCSQRGELRPVERRGLGTARSLRSLLPAHRELVKTSRKWKFRLEMGINGDAEGRGRAQFRTDPCCDGGGGRKDRGVAGRKQKAALLLFF